MNPFSIQAILWAAAGLAAAQGSFSLWDRPVQVHGFLTQGYLISDHNNYLTMKTSAGNFAMTDAGLNVSAMLTGRLRVGGQIYGRNVGDLGNGNPTLDSACVDFRMTDWLGFRGGKVKSVVGLFNDTQDNEFLHTWALLPQAMYPLDLRDSNLGHVGGDAYGTVELGRLGRLEYTVYGGRRALDPNGGISYAVTHAYSTPAGKFAVRYENGEVIGEDVRWVHPGNWLTVGASYVWNTYTGVGQGELGSLVPGPLRSLSTGIYLDRFYADFSRRGLHLFGEFEKSGAAYQQFGGPGASVLLFSYEQARTPWYVAASYRINRHLELGSYYSSYLSTAVSRGQVDKAHLNDHAVTARLDVTSHWDVKVEGHFMDGVPRGFNLRGFYDNLNPGGYQQRTNLLVVRTGLVF